jgi:hypothetical protein
VRKRQGAHAKAGAGGDVRKQRVAVVHNVAQPAVARLGRAHDARAVRHAQRLVAQADAEDGQRAAGAQ